MVALTDAPFYAPLKTTLALQNGAGTFTFGRTSSAGIVDSVTGLYTILTSGNPRFDSAKGLLLNSAAVTNTIKYSRDLTQAQTWRPSGYGSELVANGTFDSNISGWSANGTAVGTWSSGALSLQVVTAGDTESTTITCVIGQRYVVYGTVQAGAGSARILVGTTPGGSQVTLFGQPTSGAAETFSNTFVATSTTHYISVGCSSITTRLFDNITVTLAGVTPQLNQTGIDATANSCTKLTANADGATMSQPISAAASAGCSGAYIKRSSGTGKIWVTRDNFATLLDVTALINSGTFSLCAIQNTSVLNPTVGFKFEKSGDAIIVDGVMNHLGTEIASPILTTNAAVTVNAETLTYQTSGNFSDTAGTIVATVERGNWANNNGVVVGKVGVGLSTSATTLGVKALDGTNTATGNPGTPTGKMNLGMKWSGSSMSAFAFQSIGAAGSYDGAFGLSSIGLFPEGQGYIKDLAIFNSALSDTEIKSMYVGQISGIFPTLRKVTPNAMLLYSGYPAYLTKQPPSQFQSVAPLPSPGVDTVCWQRFTGTDPITNFPYPNGAPLFAINGGSQEGFGVYVTDKDSGLGTTRDQAALDSCVGVTNESLSVRGATRNVLHVNHYNHIANDFDAGVQSHFMLYRDTLAVGFADLTDICFDLYFQVPDQSATLSTTYRYRAIHAFKTTNDFRYELYFIKANATDATNFGVALGTMGMMFVADNRAGNLTGHEFIRYKKFVDGSSFILPTGFCRARLAWHRPANYDDLTTGWFKYILTDLETGLETTVFDINAASIAAYNIAQPLACVNQGGGPATNCENRHMGVTNDPWQRLFLMANYFGGVAGNDVQFWLDKIDIWSGIP